jgi:ribose transport system ATP-binding protein
VLEVVNLTKHFPGTVALDGVSIRFDDGEVHALVGKNGAGKSTLIRLLAGALAPTHGEVRVDGEPVRLGSPKHAFERGIATVHQELSLVPGLSVAENILLGRLPKRMGAIHWSAAYERAGNVLAEMNVAIDVRARAGRLGVAQQQIVEIAKAMSFKPRALLLDEPTSALAHHETDSLFELIRQLAARGVAIIYITHRLHELRQIADRVSVLRDGRHVGTVPVRDTPPQAIVQMMFGEVVQKERPRDLLVRQEHVLEVRNLTLRGWFSDVSFTLKRGEVLGIAGMLGSGRTELLKAIFGAEPADSGTIVIGGRAVRRASPTLMKHLGIAFTPENRKEEGLIQMLSTRVNVCLAGMGRIAPAGIITKRRERTVAQRFVDQLQIKISRVDDPVSSLSGGNQQKVVVANWINTQPRVILFDEPTRGIDVQAKQQIFEVMWQLSRTRNQLDLRVDGAGGTGRGLPSNPRHAPRAHRGRGEPRRGERRRAVRHVHGRGFGSGGSQAELVNQSLAKSGCIGRTLHVGRSLILEVVLLVLCVALAIKVPAFVSAENLLNILRNSSMQGIIAFGMTMVIISGEIDLSVGSAVAFAGSLTAYIIQRGVGGEGHSAEGAYLVVAGAMCASLATGFLIGATTGFLRTHFRVPTFISTLAWMTVLSGAAYLITNGFPIMPFPDWYTNLGSGYVMGLVPIPAIVFLGVFIIVHFVMSYTTFGRSVYAVGGNAEAARLSGIRVNRVKILVMGIVGLLAALAGILQSAQIQAGSPTTGTGWELDVISAVIIGGTSLMGGSGSVWGTLIGVIFLGVLGNGMTLLGTDEYWQRVVRGALILAAVLINQAQMGRIRRERASG